MAKLQFKNGQTSLILRVKIMDSASTTGGAKTGLTFSSAGLLISTIADNEASATVYTQAGSTIETITTLGTFAAPTATKCRFKEVDATNHPGLYEIQIADARWAVSGARSVIVTVSGASGAAQVDAEVQLTAVDPQDAVAGGMSRLDAAMTSRMATFTLPANFSSFVINSGDGGVTVHSSLDKTGYALTQTFPANFASLAITGGGAVTAGTVSDKTGYSLTQTFPSNFSSLAITVGGAVTAGTVSDKTGYSLTQAFPANFSSLSITAGGVVKANDASGAALAVASTALSTAQWTNARAGYQDNLSAGAVALASTALSNVQWTNPRAAALDNLDAKVSLTMLAASYVAPLDAAGTRTAVGLASANLDSQLSAIGTPVVACLDVAVSTRLAASAAPAALGMASANMDSQLAAILAASGSGGSAPTTAQIADKLLGRNLEGGADGGRTVTQALQWLRNKWTVDPATRIMTVYRNDDSTSSWTSQLTVTAGLDPVTGSDPA